MLTRLTKICWIILLILIHSLLFAGEICDNGIDDDGDGLIDLNDTTDCTCSILNVAVDASSLIPNPSFEETECCPDGPSQMSCVEGWFQAGSGTSDYHNTCGFLFPSAITAGLIPLPDGNGMVGEVFTTIYKEYVGTCLTGTMKKNNLYSLQFNIASTGVSSDGAYCNINYGVVDITLFGNTNCRNFSLGSGCPIHPWAELGHVSYLPQKKWSIVTINFIPTTDINSIILGAPCILPATGYEVNSCHPYFYFDNLSLKESVASTITPLGSMCKKNLTLMSKTPFSGATFQWYHDGIALINQKDSILSVSANNLPEGKYSVVARHDTSCILSSIEVLSSMNDSIAIDTTICAGDKLKFGSFFYEDSGAYRIALTSSQGCDSIIKLNVKVNPRPIVNVTVNAALVKYQDTVQLNAISNANTISYNWTPVPVTDMNDVTVRNPTAIINETVWFKVTVKNDKNCTNSDSVLVILNDDCPSNFLYLPGAFSPNNDGVNDCLGVFLSPIVKLQNFELLIYNRWGETVFKSNNIHDCWDGTFKGHDAETDSYSYIINAKCSSGREIAKTGTVTLLR